jgi:hypothetical protein
MYQGFMESQEHEIMKPEKKARPSKIGTPVMIRLQDGPLDAIDEWRRQQPDIPGRSEAIRRLVAFALEEIQRVRARLIALEAEAAKKKGKR